MRFFILLIAGCLFGIPLFAQDSSSFAKKIKDSSNVRLLDEIVVAASRDAERILQSPVSIEKLNTPYFTSCPAPSFFDALENVKGVQMLVPGMGFKVINTRGFANTTNVRFAQLIDGMDIQAPHLGAPIANALGPTDLDIQSVEIIAGVAASLYGMNSINGLANFTTKDPFTSEGVSVQQKTGVNRVHASNGSASVFTETALRIAHAFSDKLAFKIGGHGIKVFTTPPKNLHFHFMGVFLICLQALQPLL